MTTTTTMTAAANEARAAVVVASLPPVAAACADTACPQLGQNPAAAAASSGCEPEALSALSDATVSTQSVGDGNPIKMEA